MAKAVVQVSWQDVPHLSEETKALLLSSIPPYQRDARTKGVPTLGSGAIYPVSEDDYVVDDFPLPEHWPKVYGMDVGWNRTAAVWAAWDRDADVVYEYSEHYMGQAEPVIHAQAIKGRGDWIPGVIDPAARGRSQIDGSQLITIYRDLGLNLMPADNTREAGIYSVWQRLASGRLKTFRSCRNVITERRLYRRDEHGKIVKEIDHCMDSERYMVVTGLGLASTVPVEETEYESAHEGGWMGR